MAAGKLRSKLNFQQRSISDDGFGNPVTGEYQTIFSDAVEIIPRLGSEAVISARLQGLQPVTIRVRSHTATRAIDATWRAVDARTGAVYSVVSPPVDLDQKGAHLDMLATVGWQAAG